MHCVIESYRKWTCSLEQHFYVIVGIFEGFFLCVLGHSEEIVHFATKGEFQREVLQVSEASII